MRKQGTGTMASPQQQYAGSGLSEFDYSEDEEALAPGTPWPASRPSACQLWPAKSTLLRWASQSLRAARAPGSGNDWDYDLQAQDDDGQPLTPASTGQQAAGAAGLGHGRTTVSLCLSGSTQFGDALRQAFDLEA
jgi:hypothetical protein